MFCWGCSIPVIYAPIVDLMDFIDGDDNCNCNPSPVDLRSESGNAKRASDRNIAKTVRDARQDFGSNCKRRNRINEVRLHCFHP